MKDSFGLIAMGALALFCAGAARGHDCEHAHGVAQRGDHVMGFDHAKTTHHFRLSKQGGSIEVEANDPADEQSRDQIRKHLAHIATMFGEGNFEAPMLIHDQVPPGVPEMTKQKSAIRYAFEETARGGRVVITTSDARALVAVHDFLRFQIRDHATGDSLEVETDK
jgi:hypothetical protein